MHELRIYLLSVAVTVCQYYTLHCYYYTIQFFVNDIYNVPENNSTTYYVTSTQLIQKICQTTKVSNYQSVVTWDWFALTDPGSVSDQFSIGQQILF